MAPEWVQCWPPERLWLGTKVDGVCWIGSDVVRAYNTFVAAYSGVADIVLALLPWKIIWQAKIRPREKIAAMCCMSMGVL